MSSSLGRTAVATPCISTKSKFSQRGPEPLSIAYAASLRTCHIKKSPAAEVVRKSPAAAVALDGDPLAPGFLQLDP
jgi:hypothetical protein